jgi:hypothetical protein
MTKSRHLTAVTRSPRQAQTALQLKYDAILVYVENFYLLGLGLLANIGDQSNAITGLIEVLPFKGFFGGGGGDVVVPGDGGGELP